MDNTTNETFKPVEKRYRLKTFGTATVKVQVSARPLVKWYEKPFTKWGPWYDCSNPITEVVTIRVMMKKFNLSKLTIVWNGSRAK